MIFPNTTVKDIYKGNNVYSDINDINYSNISYNNIYNSNCPTGAPGIGD